MRIYCDVWRNESDLPGLWNARAEAEGLGGNVCGAVEASAFGVERAQIFAVRKLCEELLTIYPVERPESK